MNENPRDPEQDPENPEDKESGRRVLRDENGQPRYGVRLQGEELAEWERENAAKQNQGPVYGTFTPHQSSGSSGAYGSEYAQHQQQPYQPQAEQGRVYNPGEGPGQQQPGIDPATAETMEPPQTIKWARWLLWIAGAIYVVVNIWPAFMSGAALQSMITETMDELTQAMGEEALSLESLPYSMEAMVPMMRVTAVMSALFGALAYFLISQGIYRGSRVARIFGTIFAVLSLAYVFDLLGLVWVGLGVAAMVLTYLPTSREYFRYKAWEKVMRMAPFFGMRPPQGPGAGGQYPGQQ